MAREHAVTTAADYRQFAQECIQSARDAASEPVRKQFLDLAQLWMTAAQHMDAREAPPPSHGKGQKLDGQTPPETAH